MTWYNVIIAAITVSILVVLSIIFVAIGLDAMRKRRVRQADTKIFKVAEEARSDFS